MLDTAMQAAILRGIPPSDDVLLRLSADNPAWQFEREADGSIRMTPPASTRSGPRTTELMLQLARWNPGGQVFPPDSGFKMPDTAILSPDAAWVAQERWAGVSRDRAAFLALVPDVCAEIRSPSDTWAWVKRKVDRYVAYGACFAVAINPETREVYEAGEAPGGLKFDYDRILDAGA